MKTTHVVSILVSIISLSLCHAQSPDQLAKTIIESKLIGSRVITIDRFEYPGIPSLNKEQLEDLKFAENANRDFRDYILNKDTPEVIRIRYAITILDDKLTSSNDHKVRKDWILQQLILGNRLKQIPYKAEQGAAANP